MQSCSAPIKKYKRLKEKSWINIVHDYEQSNLSMRQFCEIHQISLSGLKNWRYRFKKKQRDTASATNHNFINFAPVKIDAELKHDSEVELVGDTDNNEFNFKIELRSNVKIIIPNNFEDKQLLRLINLLQGASDVAAK